ncbi:probable HAD superfamily hydrolase [Rhynchosporium agropyri]|uniref:Probable HAD superfamily hydrolase n=1 Tax=Rhynchosporium agropyri TaxID=914238 RepID=A0A1E1KBH1_9HELO|nr:probable HAD superfamily hydrolase [Rhynchosporium agropyri]
MGVPDSTNGEVFHEWAKLPIPREQFAHESPEQMQLYYPNCEPLPGAEKLLTNLRRARCASSGDRIELALASSTKSHSYKLQISKPGTKRLLDFFRLTDGFWVKTREYDRAEGSQHLTYSGTKAIMPNECLVFEDSVARVEAGRRAGMRVVWVPHAGVAVEYQARQKDVLAGRTGMIEIGDDWQLGDIDDGWAESIPSLEHFNYETYGFELKTVSS